ncbi:MAG: tRNA (adenosine(37)-N6)-dimethylallyltransferase MiaA [Pseudomonadota bacterium]|nr:tRNA (adenosine(37)-N6)-dimethylallyltransferase MiaA [Pseudomonadota bacterium]
MIAGPTASGKSELALHLAANIGGKIINADSMQVYKEFRILTARPTPSDEELVPHGLYGTIPVARAFSVGKWLLAAHKQVEMAVRNDQVPIFVGGTGLYLKALIDGLVTIPFVGEEVRTQATESYHRLGAERFRAELAKRDPESAKKLKVGDKQRLIRAWEVLVGTGTPLSQWRRRKNSGGIMGPSFVVKIIPERSWVYSACEQRFERMLKVGVLDEVAAVQALHLPTNLPAMKVIGFSALSEYLAGRSSLGSCKALVCQATRNFAKRQYTWFGHQLSAQKEYADLHSAKTALKSSVEEFLLTA